MTVDTARNKAIYFARLAEQAERYDEMAELMKEVNRLSPGELTEEERRLLAVAYNNTVGIRRAAWRSISDAAREASKQGDGKKADLARQYCAKVEYELEGICTRTRKAFASQQKVTDEAAVFYQKMKADTYRHAAELQKQSPRKKEVEAEAQKAYAEASKMAQSALPAAHPLQFGLALSHSIFQAEVLGDPKEACRTAPLRHLSSCGGLSPRGRAPPGEIAQRLCDLLLEFPDAAVGGVRWSTLAASYVDMYTESLDLTSLGHETSSAAAHALLAEVLRHQRQDGTGRAAEEQDDPIVAIDDMVALTPLPGFAGSWPALYKILCDLVRSCGSEEEAQSDGDLQGRILLLSQLRPLLENASDEEQTPASQARSLLLSQLRPVSKLGKECANANGLSYRDSEGCLRKLQKLGHVVKAVLQWRDRRVQWRQSKDAKPTTLDHAVGPKLELVFCKRLNNLVLCLNDQTADDMDDKWEEQNCQDTLSRHGDKPLDRHQFDDNPFKWQPVAPSNESNHAALKRSSSTPALCSSLCPPAVVEKELQTRGTMELSEEKVGGEVAIPLKGTTGEIRRASPTPSSLLRLAPRRSPSRGARSPSCPSRARSLERYDACASGATMRCTSEPPRQRWADMCDDPDECLQFHWFENVSPSNSYDTSDQAVSLTEERPRACDSGAESIQAKEKSNSAQRWVSPLASATKRADHRSPSICGRGNSRVGRARSMTPRDDSYVQSHSAMANYESTRCTSEPPQNRWLDVFDDPFEPPPQEVNWDLMRGAAEILECKNGGIAYTPLSQTLKLPVLPPVPDLSSVFHISEANEHRTCSNPCDPLLPLFLPTPTRQRARSTDRVGRARSLERSMDGSMRREARAAMEDDGEQRCTSEPPNCRCIGSFDDPFEPPPQNAWVCHSLQNQGAKDDVGAPAPDQPKSPQYGDACIAPNLFFNCQLPVQVASHRSRYHSRSLTRTSRDEPSRFSRQDLENGFTRCTSEPPHHRDVNIFDDPFEPPPQELVWSWPVSPVHMASTTQLRFGRECVWC